jgi:hypothetical protein
MKRSNKFYSPYFKRTTVKQNYIILNLSRFVPLPVKLFSTTSIKKGDPLSTTVLAFNTPYASSLLYNPFGIGFITLMGMAVCLYYLTQSIPEFVVQNPEYASVIHRMDMLLLLYERFLSSEPN